jgi:hypothetical protein
VALETTWCPVSHAAVTAVTTLEGEVTNVFCHEYDPATKACRLRTAAGRGGPLSTLLERVSDDSLGRRTARCYLV